MVAAAVAVVAAGQVVDPSADYELLVVSVVLRTVASSDLDAVERFVLDERGWRLVADIGRLAVGIVAAVHGTELAQRLLDIAAELEHCLGIAVVAQRLDDNFVESHSDAELDSEPVK